MIATLLIGLDGATFTVLDPLMARGVMPFLRGLVERGARAPLRTVMPPLTPPGWTSLMTGKRPGQHGVFDFFQKDSPHGRYFRFASAEDIHSDTIWSLASDQGRRVTLLNFPLTFPPPPINGCVVPGGWMPWRQLRLGCHPPELFDRLKALPSFQPRELALDMELEEKTVEGCLPDEYPGWIELHLRRERRWLDVARFLIEQEPADLVAIVFDGVDKLQHLCWRFLDPAIRLERPAAWEQQVVELCDSYFRQLDEIIAELVALAGPQATVVLASDHGAGPAADVFCLNTWLEQHGYLAWADDGPAPTGGTAQLGIRQLIGHIYKLDWERTVAFAATPSSQGIHLVTHRPDGTPLLSGEGYRRLRDELVEALRAARHPDTGRPVVDEVWTRERAFAGPYEALAPDISIIPADGGVVSVLRTDTTFKRRAEVGGSHRWEGVFLASGPGIRPGLTLPELSILDVAPFVLYSLGLPIPDDIVGRLPSDAFESDVLRRRPPEVAVSGISAVEPAAATAVIEMAAEDEALILQRLRALGYVE